MQGDDGNGSKNSMDRNRKTNPTEKWKMRS